MNRCGTIIIILLATVFSGYAAEPEHPLQPVDISSPRVWLDDFKRDHINLKMIYWYQPPNYWDSTAHADLFTGRSLMPSRLTASGLRCPHWPFRKRWLKNPPQIQEEQTPV